MAAIRQARSEKPKLAASDTKSGVPWGAVFFDCRVAVVPGTGHVRQCATPRFSLSGRKGIGQNKPFPAGPSHAQSMPDQPFPMIRFRGVSKRYRERAILKDLHLDVAHGECFGLVGMNGAGKTTTIKSLLDFVDLDSGSIELAGISHRVTAARRALAFLPERFNPPYYLTGSDFLRFALSLQDVALVAAQVNGMLERLDLDRAALQRPVRTYSKGMTQKLGLAACFLAQKDLYVLDEPMSGLDPKARALLKAQIGRVRTSGATVFFSTHALADVEEICDRMAVLHEGALRFVGSPRECKHKFEAATLEQAYMRCIDAEL